MYILYIYIIFSRRGARYPTSRSLVNHFVIRDCGILGSMRFSLLSEIPFRSNTVRPFLCSVSRSAYQLDVEKLVFAIISPTLAARPSMSTSTASRNPQSVSTMLEVTMCHAANITPSRIRIFCRLDPMEIHFARLRGIDFPPSSWKNN